VYLGDVTQTSNNLKHSHKAAAQARAAGANIRLQTPAEKAKSDASVLEGKLRAFGSLEAHDRHQREAQLHVPRMLVHIGILPAEHLAEVEEALR
jgi:hypothetical protein